MNHQFANAKKSIEWGMRLHNGRKVSIAAHLYKITHDLSDFLLLLEPKSVFPIAEEDIASAWNVAAQSLELVNRPYSVMLWEWSKRTKSHTLYLVTETWGRELVTTALLRQDESDVRLFSAGRKWHDTIAELGLMNSMGAAALAHK